MDRMNSNGLRLLSLCTQYHLTITDTRFQMKNKHKNNWMHPCSGYWHILDHVIVKQRDKADCVHTNGKPGADCGTDHQRQRATFRLSIRTQIRKHASTTEKLKTVLLSNELFKENFQLKVAALISL